MWITVSLIALGVIAAGLVAILLINRLRLDRHNAGLVAELLSRARPSSGVVFTHEDLKGLPEPVQIYLKKAIPEGHPYVNTVRLHQTGAFRMGDQTSPWKPFAAKQYFTVNPPGFVWDANIQMAPLVSARVVDMYQDGQGALRAKVASTLSVVDAQGRAELDAGELMRYLAEALWFPTALLPGQGVEWVPIDDHSARATIEDRGTRVSLLFYFNSRHEVERVYAEARGREVDGRYEPIPWTGYWSNYQTRDGLLIPLDGEVEWNLPEGDLAYWRGHVDDIEFGSQGERVQ
jgi:hypothetical protein